MDVPPVQYATAADGGRIAYQVFGEGALRQLFLREWAGALDAMWEHPVHLRTWAYHASLSRILAPDPRGTGASDPVPLDTVGDLDRMVDDALAVLDAEGWDRVHVWGEGYSTHAAVALAVAHPERVEALTLAMPYPCLIRSDERAYGIPPESLEALATAIADRWGTGKVISRSSPALGAGADPSFPARMERAAASPTVAAAWVRAAYQSDVSSLLPQVRVRTLVHHTPDFVYIPVEAARDVARLIPGAELLEYPESGNLYWFDDPAVTERFRRFVYGSATPPGAERVLATILFTDVVESTGRAATVGDERWSETLAGLDALVTRTTERFGGRVVKQTGDGHLLTFAIPTRALQAAKSLQAGVEKLGLGLRIGLHTGEVELRPGGDLTGIAVHAAARIMSEAGANQIFVSESVSTLVSGSGFVFDDRGVYDLRGVPGPWHLFEVRD